MERYVEARHTSVDQPWNVTVIVKRQQSTGHLYHLIGIAWYNRMRSYGGDAGYTLHEMPSPLTAVAHRQGPTLHHA